MSESLTLLFFSFFLPPFLHSAPHAQARSLVPAGNLIEVSFAELEQQPADTVLSLYRRFNWPLSMATAARLRSHQTSIEGFKKNDHVTLSPEVKALVAKRWARSFTEFGYSV
jgi:omega-hydroxy-beta-dihydromenaquinone-9 sulfotransferase